MECSRPNDPPSSIGTQALQLFSTTSGLQRCNASVCSCRETLSCILIHSALQHLPRGSPLADRTAADLSLGAACDVKRVAPTSQSQRALWVLCQALSNDSVYNEAHVVRIRGLLDVDALAKALEGRSSPR